MVNAVEIQGWMHQCELPVPTFHEPEVHKFYYNIDFVHGGSLNNMVGRVIFYLNEKTLGKSLKVP